VQLGIQTFFCFPQRLSSTEFFLLLCFIFTDVVLFFLIRNVFVLPVITALLLHWPVVDTGLVLQQALPPVSCWTETRPQGSQLYLAGPAATEAAQTQPCKGITETGVKLHQKATNTAKNFTLILLRKKQAEGSAPWSEIEASAS